MTSGERGMPLRPGDPRQLGKYRLLRRLGEGGMGSVYLADSPEGRTVALKIIRADLAEEPEFRRRFRSEVARAQEVPPFCTAEVLDADPDHETPYLVVEFVDGPSLSEVVLDRGPLTPANLYGLSIGVATALAAIHSADVVHRDLKPSNVLLAPGTPKVIDFGIARGADGNDGDTRTDQLIGTVAYMAPERLDPAIIGRTITAAADVFAWGAVVAFAATGRVPFLGDSSPATAVAILTQQPNLDGITEPLRSLVGRALAKDPDERPSARELLDLLLTQTPKRVLDRAAKQTAEIPVIADRVEEAEKAADIAAEIAAHAAASAEERTEAVAEEALVRDDGPESSEDSAEPAAAVLVAADAAGVVDAGYAVEAADAGAPAAVKSRVDGKGSARKRRQRSRSAAAAPEESAHVEPARLSSGLRHAYVDVTSEIPRYSVARATAPVETRPPMPNDGAYTGDGLYIAPRGFLRKLGITALVLIVLLTAGAVAGFATGYLKLPAAAQATEPPSAPPSVGTDLFAFPEITDSLTRRSYWDARAYPQYDSTCAFTGNGMLVEMRSADRTPSIRCPGPGTSFSNFSLTVYVTLLTPKTCGGIWWDLARRGSTTGTGVIGYAMRVCANNLYIGVNTLSDFTPFATVPLTDPIAVNAQTKIQIVVDGSTVQLFENDVPVGAPIPTIAVYSSGYIGLGAFETQGESGAPFKVLFSDIEVDTAGPPPSSSSSAGPA